MRHAASEGKGGARVARGRRPRLSQSADTREAILDAAEQHFSEHGFYGVTVRQVAKGAGVDPALLHYYFETKRGLFDATFARRARILNEMRVASLNAYRAGAGPAATAEGCLAAFLRPMWPLLAEEAPGWRRYFRLVAIVNNTPAWGGETMGRDFDPAIQQLVQALREVMPDARDCDLYWGWSFISGALTLAIAETGRIERLSDGLCRSDDVAAIEARLAPFMAAGVEEICRRGAGAATSGP